jgi:hypothetical protein
MSSTYTLTRTRSASLSNKFPPGLGYGHISLAPSLDSYCPTPLGQSESFYSSPNITIGSGAGHSRKRAAPALSAVPSVRRRPAPPPPHSALSRVAPASVTSELGRQNTFSDPPRTRARSQSFYVPSYSHVPTIRTPTPRLPSATPPSASLHSISVSMPRMVISSSPSPPPAAPAPSVVRPIPDRASCARLVAGMLLHRSEPGRRCLPWPRDRSRVYVKSALGANVITAEA